MHGAKRWTFVAPEHLRYLSSLDGLTYFHSHQGATLDSAHVPEVDALPQLPHEEFARRLAALWARRI